MKGTNVVVLFILIDTTYFQQLGGHVEVKIKCANN